MHAYMLEMSYLRDAEMWNSFDPIPCAQYDEMDCEYDTMEDAPEASSDHVAVVPSTTTTSVPVLALP